MNIQIVGKNIKVTDGIKSAVNKKISKLEKYFNDKDNEILVIVLVRTYKIGSKIEVTIFTPNYDFRAEVMDNDLYDGIDKVVDKLEGQMRKLKTRMDRRKDKVGLGKAVVLENIKEEVIEDENAQIVRSKSIFLDPITLDEAIKHMEALGHSFYIYLDSDDERVCVVYKRELGGYGLIEVENSLDKSLK